MFRLTSLMLSLMVSSAAYATKFEALNDIPQNPGELTASFQSGQDNAPLLVAMHGCRQNAEHFAEQSGIAKQAAKHGWHVLLPQQLESNNATLCFNWFSEQDQSKDQGEVQSIMSMIESYKRQFNVSSVYIVGLSAGGAMAANLVSHYPTEFKGAAVIAGIPYQCADGLIKAISCMKSGPSSPAKEMVSVLPKQRPDALSLIVLTGSKDAIVNPKNAKVMAEQWRAYLSLPESATSHLQGQATISTWQKDHLSVQLVELAELDHGISVNSKINDGGQPEPFYLDSDFSTAQYLFENWKTK